MRCGICPREAWRGGKQHGIPLAFGVDVEQGFADRLVTVEPPFAVCFEPGFHDLTNADLGS
jgi:hypothetical protein